MDSYSVPATGAQNSSHLSASLTFTMPFTFSFEEYADMIYVYWFCDGNSVLAVAEYQQRFPNRRIPNGSRQLHRYIMFTDEAQFNRDGVNNTHNSHVWADENCPRHC